MWNTLIDLTGQRFGRLTVINRAENRGRRTCWLCKCDCGNTVTIVGDSLKAGRTKSCGCYNKEKSITHGMKKSPLYQVWMSMMKRCYNPKAAYYHRYGGRGITVCEEWKADRAVFFDWAQKNGYKEGLQLDRIDNDGPYSPENCRWATPEENSNHTAKTAYLTYNGETRPIKEWAKITGIPYSRIQTRAKAGKPPEEVLKEYIK